MAKLTAREVAAAHKLARGTGASKSFAQYWIGKDPAQLRAALLKDPNTSQEYITRASPTAAPTVPGVPTYDEFLAGAGSSYANAFSDETINQQFDPFYQSQLGGEDYQKQLATEDLARNQALATKNIGINAADRGLFGSGIYQQDLGTALDTLSRGYEQQYGANQYTPYNQRRQQILQNQMVAKEQAKLSRQGQAFQAYQTQYYPVISQT